MAPKVTSQHRERTRLRISVTGWELSDGCLLQKWVVYCWFDIISLINDHRLIDWYQIRLFLWQPVHFEGYSNRKNPQTIDVGIQVVKNDHHCCRMAIIVVEWPSLFSKLQARIGTLYVCRVVSRITLEIPNEMSFRIQIIILTSKD